jgi:hypothetical protein
MNRMFSRFPDETVKRTSAFQLITYARFLPGTGYLKSPVNPVNPVYIIKN